LTSIKKHTNFILNNIYISIVAKGQYNFATTCGKSIYKIPEQNTKKGTIS